MLLQQKLISALESSKSLDQFISNCGKSGVYLLFNQSKNGYVSGLTFIMEDGFIANASKIGESFKWNSLKNKFNYEQVRDGEKISSTNRETRRQFENFDFGVRGIKENSSQNSQNSRFNETKGRDFGATSGRSGRENHENQFGATSESNSRDKRSESENQETFFDQLSSRTSAFTVISNSLSNSQNVDELEEEKRRRRRRR